MIAKVSLVGTIFAAKVCSRALESKTTGVNDVVTAGVNGEIVPIRDLHTIAGAIFTWRDKVLSDSWEPRALLDIGQFSFEHFAQVFVQQLRIIGLAV
jgi:hypothetical protein